MSEHYLKKELYQLIQTDPTVFRFLHDTALDGVWFWDLDDQEHEWMSPGFWRSMGYDPAEREHLAAEWMDLIHPDDLKSAVANLERHLADPSHPYDQVVRYTRADGGTLWVRCCGLAIRDADGVPRRLVGAHVDITAEKERERELQERAVELAQVNEQLEQFAYAASHDLMSPLRSIQEAVGRLHAAMPPDASAGSTAFVSRIESGADRMQSLTQGLLQFARLGVDVPAERVSLRAVLDECCARLERALDDAGAIVEIGELQAVQANAVQLETLFQNLLQNAVRYRSEDRPLVVRVASERVGRTVVVRVEDNGIGIQPKFQEKVFDMFRRLHPVGARGPGVGVGLALCRKIAARNGGEIAVESDGVTGSTFFVSLPSAHD